MSSDGSDSTRGQTSSRPSAPSDAILTVPNLLTFARLALIPVFLWLALGPDRLDLALAIAVGGLATDLVDGKIARRYGQISKLGVALDPLADRLALAAGIVVLLAHGLAPLWIVAAVAARDVALVVVGAPLLKAAGAPIPPVTRVGKAGSFAISVAFASFLASGWPGPEDPVDAVRTIGIVVSIVGLPLYYAAGAGYVRAGLSALKAARAGSASRGGG